MSLDIALWNGKSSVPVSELGQEIGRVIRNSGARVEELRIAVELKVEHREEILAMRTSTKQKLIGVGVLACGVGAIAVGGTAQTVIGIVAILLGVVALWTGYEIDEGTA